MRKLITILILMLMAPLGIWAQSYDALWKQVDEAEAKDLPKTQIGVLKKIVAKAAKDKSYGNLLAAELLTSSLWTQISPDSVEIETKRLNALCAKAERTDPVLAAVYNCALGRLFDTDNDNPDKTKNYYDKAIAQPRLLATQKIDAYVPLIQKGKDDALFGNDLLHVIALETQRYEEAKTYYDKVGNREAAFYMALMKWNQNPKEATAEMLIKTYGDLPICGALAIKLYHLKTSSSNFTPSQRIAYIDNALSRWPSWQGMKMLRNERSQLCAPMFDAYIDKEVGLPNRTNTIKQIHIRNIADLRLTITRTTLDGTMTIQGGEKHLARIKQSCLPETAKTIVRQYPGYQPWEIVDDSIALPPLEKGVYLFKFASSSKDIKPQYELYYVSNLYVISEEQPNHKIRYAVVTADTGQPVPGAKLRLTPKGRYGNPNKVETLTTNDKGEACYTYAESEPDYIYAYTNDDKACRENSLWNSFLFSKFSDGDNVCNLFTDRSIYRPGQTVHASLVYYHRDNKHLITKALPNERLTVKLRNANYDIVTEKEVTTDEMGTAAVDFDLSKDGLTGNFSLVVDNLGTTSFQVEEYKRPTFQVEFDKYEQRYAVGDTIKVRGKAKSFAGVPVQGAKVEYTVNRRMAEWYWGYSNDIEELSDGEVVTNEKGEFEIEVPLIFPEKGEFEDESYANRSRFFRFVVDAKVTDQAGETREGSTSLPLGDKATALTCSLPDRMLRNNLPTFLFGYHNAAGAPIEGKVRYAIAPYKKDNKAFGKYQEVAANSELKLKNLNSGHYQLHAICGTDTLTQAFVVFSMDDKQPVYETRDWFYVSDHQFPQDGSPVYVQVGSSDANQHILYTICSGNTVLESGTIDQSNALTTRKFTYKTEYGEGITLTFAWVKEGKLYAHSADIRRPEPEKKLNVKWTTFRNRLTPGQDEEWTLAITHPNGKAAKAQLMATLYDKCLDGILKHRWSLAPRFYSATPSLNWRGFEFDDFSVGYEKLYSYRTVPSLSFAEFDNRFVDNFGPILYFDRSTRGYDATVLTAMPMEEAASAKQEVMVRGAKKPLLAKTTVELETSSRVKLYGARSNGDIITAEDEKQQTSKLQLRENLNETAFFYPRLATETDGTVKVKFTLPESLTTWHFIGIAHDADLNTGFIESDIVAQKTVMIQPNMPRFVRMGDAPTVASRLINTADKQVKGTATIEIVDPETEQVVYTQSKDYTLEPKATSSVNFSLAPLFADDSAQQLAADRQMVIVRVFAKGADYSDGEQQYLAVLPNRAYVVNTYPFTQNEAGVKTVDLGRLFPKNTTAKRLTVEYTNNPNWLMIQALPYVGNANEMNAISLVTAYYANSLANKVINTSPKIRQTIEKWRNEKGSETSMMSALQKNEDLKTLVLNETPWVMEAKNETEQKQQLVRYFDKNQLRNNLAQSLKGLQQLQNPDGSFSWWKGMRGSFYMTVAVVKNLTRLNTLMGENDAQTQSIITSAFRFLDHETAARVADLKRLEKKGYKHLAPSDDLCDYLYSNALAKRGTTADITYLINLLTKKPVDLTIYGKANTAVILQQYNQTKKAAEYLQSIKEYMVYKEEMGRYFDTKHAYYSWRNYKIPTQVAAIEAFKTIAPTDKQTLQEMQRWLLQEKRTQAWDTPVNAVDAIWAFMDNGKWTMDNGEPSVLKLDGVPMETPQATAGIGYIKVSQSIEPTAQDKAAGKDAMPRTFSVEKTSTGTSWGAVYAQFFQPATEIEAANSGLKVKRELLLVNHNKERAEGRTLQVGDKVLVRLTITADRDYDFVQVVDKRAACLEPVEQLSGYQWGGYYISPKDNTTNYYFDLMAKGTHVVETEYFVDRTGIYQTGTCTAQCAYAPEYTGREGAKKIEVKE